MKLTCQTLQPGSSNLCLFAGLTGNSLEKHILEICSDPPIIDRGEREEVETHLGESPPVVRLATKQQLTVESGSRVSRIVAKIQ